jgi:thiamine-phosphate pyrophosphorylase
MAARGVPRPGPLYGIADLGALGETSPADAAAAMAEAGISWIQVRAKAPGLPDRELYRLAEACVRRLEGSGAKLWIDDRADLAALLPFSGVHLGQDDLPPEAARRAVGEVAWIGLSTHDEAQVAAAEADPDVDVVAFGPVFSTTGKERPDPVVGLSGLKRARALTRKPLVAIGGISADNLSQVLAAGADTAAVLGAVCRGDVRANCRRLLAAAGEAGLRAGRAMRIFLTGFMGSGKSAVGRLLAVRLGAPFVDLDREVEAGAAATVAEIFAAEGEAGFRRREAEALRATAALPSAVVATGGGVVASEANRRWMRAEGLVVWLDADFPVLAARLDERARRARPLFRDEREAERLWRERLPAYRDCDLAHRVGAEETAEESARALAEALSRRKEQACAS